jgi:hypothetical protein
LLFPLGTSLFFIRFSPGSNQVLFFKIMVLEYLPDSHTIVAIHFSVVFTSVQYKTDRRVRIQTGL